MKKFVSMFVVISMLVSLSVGINASAVSNVTTPLSGTQSAECGSYFVASFTATSKPNVCTGNSSIATVSTWYNKGNTWYYKINMIGKQGESTGVYAGLTNSTRKLAFYAKVSTSDVTCDQASPLVLANGSGNYETFYVKSKGVPNLTCGTNGIVKLVYCSNGSYDNNYLFQAIALVDDGTTGIYANGKHILDIKIPTVKEYLGDPIVCGGSAKQDFQVINNYRIKKGVAPLKFNEALSKVATARASYLIMGGELGAAAGEGDRALPNEFKSYNCVGWAPGGFWGMDDDSGTGFDTTGTNMDSYLLDSNYTDIGIGCVQWGLGVKEYCILGYIE